jgi:heat shock protein HslJ
MRACIEDERMKIERDFLDGLEKANRYEIQREKLMLYQSNRLLLTFKGEAK